MYPGFERRFAALPRLEKGRALAFGVPDGTWLPGASRVTWARGVRAVVRYGMETAVLCPVFPRLGLRAPSGCCGVDPDSPHGEGLV